MTDSEYEYIQEILSKLLAKERLNRKVPCEKYRDTYKSAVLDCKSKLHEIHRLRKERLASRKEHK